MIRSCAILLLIITAAVASIPASSSHSQPNQPGRFASPSLQSYDPPGSLNAFNYSYSQANIYTNGSATNPQQLPAGFPASNVSGRTLIWFSTVNRTSNNTPIPNTGFRFNVTKSNIVQGKVVYNWTLTVPKFNCSGCTNVNVQFNFFGKITSGTNATYALYPLSPPNSTKIASGSYASPGRFPSSSTSGCPENVCIDVTKYVGYNVTLSFIFAWNASPTPGMGVDVGEISVASIGNLYPSTTNSMQRDNTNPNQIDHTTTIGSIGYNNTLTTLVQPSNTNQTRLWWHTEVISIYYPVGYTNLQISMNSTDPNKPTQMFPAPPSPLNYTMVVPFENDHCFNAPACSQALVALNVTDFHVTAHSSTITIITNTRNTITSLTTLASGAPSQLFSPGDTVSVKVVNNASIVNGTTTQKTGSLNFLFFDQSNAAHTLSGSQTLPVSTIAGGVYNFTLPSDCTLCGAWNILANFTSGFELGLKTATFQMDVIQVTSGSFTVSGDNTGLNVQGTLTTFNGTSVPTASGYIFAIDEGTPTSIPATPVTNSSSGSGLYISNVTIINAVFTQDQPLIMTFTIVNPGSVSYNASMRIEHEWPGSPAQTHGVYANFTVGSGDGLGDLPITAALPSGASLTYEAAFTLTGSGPQMSITSLKTGNTEAVPVSFGSSPVSRTESHAGLFKFTVTSKAGSSIVAVNTLTSSPYAYVFGLPSSPSRFLAVSPIFTGTSFAVKITSDTIVGAKKLVVFALARDSSGRILANNSLNPGFTDSTALAASMDSVGQVAKGQGATATLHLTSNASKITQIITLNLNLQGVGMVAQVTGVTIGPGATQTVSLSFTAPSTPGQYALSFSSPQYNGNVALASQTLQVTIVQSNLQILIPAAIGVVAAIVVLGVYLIRRQPEAEVEEQTKARPSDQKTRPAPKNPPTKSLTQTGRL